MFASFIQPCYSSILMKVLNTTHYYHLGSKLYNEVPDPHSFGSESSRRQSFFLRMYFEHDYVLKNGGKSFFISFTYNNKSIPYLRFGDKKYHVFNYDHIRLITNGKISKILLRDYGCKLTYLCAPESGDGGTAEHHERGQGNNPHYHFIFNVIPIPDKFIKMITPEEFFALCQEVWQGKRGYFPWKKARFGSVKPGKYGIEVVDHRAFKYVAKYCLKDSKMLSIESDIRSCYYSEALTYRYSLNRFKAYYQYLKSFNPDLSISHFCGLFDAKSFFKYRHNDRSLTIETYANKFLVDFIPTNDPTFFPWVRQNFIKYNEFFLSEFVSDYVEAKFQTFKNKYSGKVRCSKSLGISGLSYVLEPDSNPHFKLFESTGPKSYKLPLYYIRHLYFDVVKCPYTGNPLYCLNSRGKNLKIVTLSSSVSKLYHTTLNNVTSLLNNNLDFHFKSVTYDVPALASDLVNSPDYMNIVYKYSLYCCVYKHRLYSSRSSLRLSSSFLFSEILEDYDMFLDHDRFKIDFEEGTIFNLFAQDPPASEFCNHPLFKSLIDVFDLLDSINSFVSNRKSDIHKETFANRSEEMKKQNAYVANISS